MEQMIQALAGAQWGDWKTKLATHLQIEEAQAGEVLGGAAQQVLGLFTQGKLNLANLQTSEGVAALLKQLDLASLAHQVGIEPARLEGNLGKVLPELVEMASSLLTGSGLAGLFGNLRNDLR